MKTKDMRPGQTLVYCRESGGPEAGLRYGATPRYCAARVLDVKWPGTFLGYRSPLDKASEHEKALRDIRHVESQGVLIEYTEQVWGIGRSGEPRIALAVVPARQLYDLDVTLLDAYWEAQRESAKTARARREAKEADVNRRHGAALRHAEKIVGDPSGGAPTVTIALDVLERLVIAAQVSAS